MSNTLVIIPARGGSKGIIGKNSKLLNGKPLIEYSIEVARQLFDDAAICVSTDDEHIKELVEQTGLQVPFLRPAELATDTAATQDVLLHAIDYYEKEYGRSFDALMLLQPTSPFRKAAHLQEAMALFQSPIDMVVSVKKTKANPYYTLFEMGSIGYLTKSKPSTLTRRQDLPTVYELNGSIYVMRIDSLRKNRIADFEKIIPYLMDDIYSVDIDNEIDWKLAEILQRDFITAAGS